MTSLPSLIITYGQLLKYFSTLKGSNSSSFRQQLLMYIWVSWLWWVEIKSVKMMSVQKYLLLSLRIQYVCLYVDSSINGLQGQRWQEVKCVRLTGLECSTVKKSGLHRNLALGDWSSRERRERPLEWATALSRRYSASKSTHTSQTLRQGDTKHTQKTAYFMNMRHFKMYISSMMCQGYKRNTDYCYSETFVYKIIAFSALLPRFLP